MKEEKGEIRMQNKKQAEQEECRITEAAVEDYRIYLVEEEKSRSSIEKYIRNIRKFMEYAGGQDIDKGMVVSYKESLMESGKYKVSSINSMLNDINQFLEYRGWYGLRVKTYRV